MLVAGCLERRFVFAVSLDTGQEVLMSRLTARGSVSYVLFN
jgi:hypothetical protein